MKKIKMFAALIMMTMLAIGADAQVTPQKTRIKQGVRSGELTRQETRKIVKQKKELRKM
jgi:hypothetical protein